MTLVHEPLEALQHQEMSDNHRNGDGGHWKNVANVMKVRKRNGDLEAVDVNKIVNSVARCSEGLTGVDPMRVATRTISALADGATTRELDELSIRTAAGLIVTEPNYSKLAARLMSTYVDKEVRNQNIPWFTESIACGHKLGLIGDDTAAFAEANAPALNSSISTLRDRDFEFFGLRTVYDRYLLRHPNTRQVIETPQYFFLRVACGLSDDLDEAVAFYDLMSSLAYLPSSPTLFNSGTVHPQMSSCYLLDSPEDSLVGIYNSYTDIARLSKFAGGIGVAWHRIRSNGSLIKGTNGLSNGIIPWLKTLDCSVAAVNQGGRRKGAACVYLESWHADVEDFLELKENTGDHARRAHNLNLANWVPDLFMERVEKDAQWSLFDPKKVPHLTDLYGEEFRAAYEEAEDAGLYEKQVLARQLYSRMMRSLAQTGNGWMTFKDASNLRCNQTGQKNRTVHLSNLCTEIIEVTNSDEIAVCNLGSVNLGAFVNSQAKGKDNIEQTDEIDLDTLMDFNRLGEVVRSVVPFLDRVIDINFYPARQANASNAKWRPVGLGLMGLQDVFFQLGLPFDCETSRKLSTRISEEIYFNALWASSELSEKHGPHPTFDETRIAQGHLQFDLCDKEPTDVERWQTLRDRISKYGLRNSLLIAIAPTVTIASIAGCYECIEPQVSNLFKRETLSGEFLQINRYLVQDLQELGLWDEQMIADVKRAEGSISNIERIPEKLKVVYRTAWEIPQRSLIDMAADRGAFIDQSQSLNLFMESPTIGKLSSMYLHAWKSGLKTTYYLRSRPATRINQTTTRSSNSAVSDSEAVACSLENPETCEACD